MLLQLPGLRGRGLETLRRESISRASMGAWQSTGAARHGVGRGHPFGLGTWAGCSHPGGTTSPLLSVPTQSLTPGSGTFVGAEGLGGCRAQRWSRGCQSRAPGRAGAASWVPCTLTLRTAPTPRWARGHAGCARRRGDTTWCHTTTPKHPPAPMGTAPPHGGRGIPELPGPQQLKRCHRERGPRCHHPLCTPGTPAPTSPRSPRAPPKRHLPSGPGRAHPAGTQGRCGHPRGGVLGASSRGGGGRTHPWGTRVCAQPAARAHARGHADAHGHAPGRAPNKAAPPPLSAIPSPVTGGGGDPATCAPRGRRYLRLPPGPVPSRPAPLRSGAVAAASMRGAAAAAGAVPGVGGGHRGFWGGERGWRRHRGWGPRAASVAATPLPPQRTPSPGPPPCSPPPRHPGVWVGVSPVQPPRDPQGCATPTRPGAAGTWLAPWPGRWVRGTSPPVAPSPGWGGGGSGTEPLPLPTSCCRRMLRSPASPRGLWRWLHPAATGPEGRGHRGSPLSPPRGRGGLPHTPRPGGARGGENVPVSLPAALPLLPGSGFV